MSNDNYEKALEYYNNGDYDKAIYWYEKAAEQGEAAMQASLAYRYHIGDEIKQDYTKAIYWYTKAAEQGHIISQNNLGAIYMDHEHGGADYGKAMYWFTRAAENGSVDAQYNLALMHCKGEEIKQDYAKAVFWYQKAAEQDCVDAQLILGWMYAKGNGVEKDERKAVYWYTKAAEQGDVSAQNNLASMYDVGEGVEQNYQKAIYWFEQSAKQGCAHAQVNIGKHYFHGQGVKRNYNKAFELFNAAAKQEDCPSSTYFYLAECYYNGYGVKPNWQKVKECFQTAIDNGYNCRYALEMIKRDLREYDDSNGIKAYADSVIEKKLFAPDMLAIIKKDLENDFGEYWTQLKDNAQKALISGVFSFINFYSLGEELYSALDFTPCITAMAKALETELAEFFFKHYLAFLKKKGISPTEFSENQCFINVIQDEEEEIYSFANNDETYKFSLGSLWYIIEVKTELPTDIESVGRSPRYRKQGRGITTISKHVIEFANELFKEDAFSEINREQEMVNYLIDLATDVKDIKKIRNPAAHSDTMTCAHAEVCGDYLIKVRKLICNILSKIKDEYK